eukprot:m.37143 g.37143  ORF g.37143 m.37143 type:complete len:110 (-) comp11510_c0_seq1:519-848(-)
MREPRNHAAKATTDESKTEKNNKTDNFEVMKEAETRASTSIRATHLVSGSCLRARPLQRRDHKGLESQVVGQHAVDLRQQRHYLLDGHVGLLHLLAEHVDSLELLCCAC